ncbi:14353_t:CDS:2 [Funneliformis geosporum]|nr:14353_t:CDS:2 [Funneliformis geosporum]
MSKKLLLSRKDTVQLPCGQAKPGRKLASLVNVKLKVFSNGTYQMEVKGQITSDLLKKAAGEKKVISKAELKKIAEIQLPYLKTENLEKAQKTIAGTAKSAGIKIGE